MGDRREKINIFTIQWLMNESLIYLSQTIKSRSPVTLKLLLLLVLTF